MEWGSPKEYQSSELEDMEAEILPHKKVKKSKICKVWKGEHQYYEASRHGSITFPGEFLIEFRCKCGKRKLEFEHEN